MTAAALAGSLGRNDAAQEHEGLVGMIARICRSQLAAAIGNIGAVIPTALVVHLLWTAARGQPFLDEASARYVLESLDARSFSTWWFAGLTGVFLWCSSVGAGWLENWAVYRRLPEAIAAHRLGRVVGRTGCSGSRARSPATWPASAATSRWGRSSAWSPSSASSPACRSACCT